LQAEADRRGLSLADYALVRLFGDPSQAGAAAATRLAAIDAAMGALSGSGISSDAFMRERREELEREEARWQGRAGPRSG
jgi:hypothetical protein